MEVEAWNARIPVCKGSSSSKLTMESSFAVVGIPWATPDGSPVAELDSFPERGNKHWIVELDNKEQEVKILKPWFPGSSHAVATR